MTIDEIRAALRELVTFETWADLASLGGLVAAIAVIGSILVR